MFYDHYTVRAWDYPALVETYLSAAEIAREYHIPALVHVIDVTQPQGHSTSGSHERYKSAERLKWEEEFDGHKKMRTWMTDNRMISKPELDSLEKADYETVEGFRKAAWDAYLSPITDERNQVMDMLDEIAPTSNHVAELRLLRDRLATLPSYTRRDIHSIAHEALRLLRDESHPSKQVLIQWKHENDVGYGPVPATQKAFKKAGMTLKDIQLIEVNEAFAAQYIACEMGLGLDRSITNVNGSGIGLGHPVGCTGLRLVVSLVYEMTRRNLERGLATLCVGGGMGLTTIAARD